MSQPFVHLELTTPNLEASKKFYGELCGWQFHDMPMPEFGTYSVFRPSDGPGGGMFTMPGVPNMWLPYIGVDDVAATKEKAVALGAIVIRDVTEVPNMGLFIILGDPNGSAIAFWQSTAPMQAA